MSGVLWLELDSPSESSCFRWLTSPSLNGAFRRPGPWRAAVQVIALSSLPEPVAAKYYHMRRRGRHLGGGR